MCSELTMIDLKIAIKIIKERPFLPVILFFVFCLIIFGIIFYRHIWLTVKTEPEITGIKVEIKQDFYKAISENIESRKKRFLEIQGKIFPEIFQ